MRGFIKTLLFAAAMLLSSARAMKDESGDGPPTQNAPTQTPPTGKKEDVVKAPAPVATPASPVFSDAQLSELAKKIGLSDTVTDIVDRAVASKIEDEPDGRDTVLARLRDAPGMESQWPKWSEEFDWWKQTPLPPSPGIEYLLRGYSPQHVEFKQQPFFFGLYGGTPSYDGHIIPKGMSFGIDDKIYTDIYMFQGSLDARDTLCGEMVSVYPSACADLKIVQMADEARARGNIMVYIRTTAITHTLVAPAIHSTRKSESPLVKK